MIIISNMAKTCDLDITMNSEGGKHLIVAIGLTAGVGELEFAKIAQELTTNHAAPRLLVQLNDTKHVMDMRGGTVVVQHLDWPTAEKSGRFQNQEAANPLFGRLAEPFFILANLPLTAAALFPEFPFFD